MDEAASGGMTVFPNPVTGNSFFIRTGSGPVSKDLPLRLYSINGQLLISKWIKKGESGLIEIIDHFTGCSHIACPPEARKSDTNTVVLSTIRCSFRTWVAVGTAGSSK